MSWASKKWKGLTGGITSGIKSIKKDFRINRHSLGRDIRRVGVKATRWITMYEMGALVGGDYTEAKATAAVGENTAGRAYRKQKLAIEEMKKIDKRKAAEWQEQLEEQKRNRLEQRKTQIDALREKTGVGGVSKSARSQRVMNAKARKETLG